MIIYTNKGNPFGLKLLISSKLAKKEVIVEQVNITSEYQFVVVICHLFCQFCNICNLEKKICLL